MNNNKYVKLYILLLVTGFVLCYIVFSHSEECKDKNLYFINPQLNCGEKPVVEKSGYVSLKVELENFIKKLKTERRVTDVSIYFRDLHSGPTLGINEHEVFSPASLLKLPLFLTYQDLKYTTYPNIYDRKIVYKEKGTYFLEQKIAPEKTLENGKEYSIGEMINMMMIYSDNRSYYELVDYIRGISPNRDLIKETFIDLGIITPETSLDNTISVKSYGSIFVQLYNSSFLNNTELSNEVLEVLAQSEWKKGINIGVPEGIKVAHKFGERFDFSVDLVQLHDCGIVYYPKNPYLLCVMTRGYDFDQLSKIIGDISRMVYEEFNSRKI